MASFFEKLRKGMGIEESESEQIEEAEETENIEETTVSSPASLQVKSTIEKKPVKRKRILKPKKIAVEETTVSSPASLQGKSATEEELSKKEMEEKKSPFAPAVAEALTIKKGAKAKEDWLEPEGELTIDVYQTETELVIQSAIAGVKPEDLDISMERDVITIKGNRQKPFEEEGDYFAQECYWGPFSREVILPAEVDPERTEAVMKDGILTIRIPKILREKLLRIKVRI